VGSSGANRWVEITFTALSSVFEACSDIRLLSELGYFQEKVQFVRKKQAVLAEENLLVNLTLHGFPASLLTEFAEKIVSPYYDGNLNAALQDLVQKVLIEQEFVHSYITMVRRGSNR